MVVVAIDRTTRLTETLRADAQKALAKALRAGDQIVFVTFAETSRTGHLREVAVLMVDTPPTAAQQRAVPMSKLKPLTNCLQLQLVRARRDLERLTHTLTEPSEGEAARSEIISALRDIGPRLQASGTRERVLVLLSDGLEHSSLASFYAHRGLRKVNAEGELATLKARRGIANLAGVRVYVIGGGLHAADVGARESTDLDDLQAFWTGYVEASGGKLVGFGRPALLFPIE